MKTTLSSQLNTATWIVAGLLLIMSLIKSPPADQFTGYVIAALFWMAAYYLFSLYMAPAFLLKGKLVEFFVISTLILLLLPFVGYSLLLFSRALFAGNFTNFYQGYSVNMHLSGFKAMVMAGVFGSFFRLIAEHFRK
jgi:hypothetical protein